MFQGAAPDLNWQRLKYRPKSGFQFHFSHASFLTEDQQRALTGLAELLTSLFET